MPGHETALCHLCKVCSRNPGSCGVSDSLSNEFRRGQAMDKKDFAAIELLLRMGARKLELYSSPGVRDIH